MKMRETSFNRSNPDGLGAGTVSLCTSRYCSVVIFSVVQRVLYCFDDDISIAFENHLLS